MVKHTQTIRRLLATNCLSLFDNFVSLALKGLIKELDVKNIFIYSSQSPWNELVKNVINVTGSPLDKVFFKKNLCGFQNVSKSCYLYPQKVPTLLRVWILVNSIFFATLWKKLPVIIDMRMKDHPSDTIPWLIYKI